MDEARSDRHEVGAEALPVSDGGSPKLVVEGRAAAAMRGTTLVMGGRAVQLLLSLISLTVLARYLSPTDYGLIAMATVIVGIAGVLGDFGISLSALRSTVLPRVERDTLLWLSGGLGLALAGILALLAPLVADFYQEPIVSVIIWTLTPIFVLNGFAGQYRVDATRRRMYRSLAIADMSCSVVGLVVAVVAALAGLGFWALVLQNWAATVVNLVVIVVSCRWLPGLPSLRRGRARYHLGFGALSSGTQIANYLSAQVDTVALGRFLGPAILGVYNRAYQLFTLPVVQLTAPLTGIMLPLLAQVGAPDLPRVLIRVQRCLTYTILGVCLLLAAGGKPLVAIVLGPGWGQAGDILQVLMIGALFQISGYIYYWAFLVTGRTGLLFWTEMPPRLMMTLLIVIGATQGALGAAWAHSFGLLLCWIVPATVGMRRLGWRPSSFMLGCLRPVLLYVLLYLAAAGVRELLGDVGANDLWTVASTSAVVFLGVGLAALNKYFRADLMEILNLVGSLRRRS